MIFLYSPRDSPNAKDSEALDVRQISDITCNRGYTAALLNKHAVNVEAYEGRVQASTVRTRPSYPNAPDLC
jgi:hypothetical protein